MTTEVETVTTEVLSEVKASESKQDSGETSSMEEALAAAQAMQDLSTMCDGGQGNTRDPQEDPGIACNIDEMRSAFYGTSLNLFQAAKSLKPYDILYTDTLLTQAQYFLNLADNYDTLYSIATMSKEMPLTKLSSKVPDEVVNQIDDYATAIQSRLATLKNKANVSEDVVANVDSLANAIQAKLNQQVK